MNFLTFFVFAYLAKALDEPYLSDETERFHTYGLINTIKKLKAASESLIKTKTLILNSHFFTIAVIHGITIFPNN